MKVNGRSYSRWDGFVWGIGLIALGCVFLLHYLDLLEWRAFRLWWPWLTIGFGVLTLLTARKPHRVGDGVTWVLMGLWFLVAVNHMYRLTWGTSWPLALVAVGFGSIARALASMVMKRTNRDDEVKVDVVS